MSTTDSHDAPPHGFDPAPADLAADDPAAAAEIEPLRVVEAILFSTDAPLAPAKIAGILGFGNAREIRDFVKRLNEEYAARRSAFRIEEIAGGLQMLTLPAYNRWLGKLLKTRQETKLTPAALETLSIIAYKQPCTRADVEAVRGVACGEVVNRLREMDLVKIVGRAEDLGRPMLYGTTRRFLEVFGLPSLKDLPEVEALKRSVEQTSTRGRKPAPAGNAMDASRADESAIDALADHEPHPSPAPADDALNEYNRALPTPEAAPLHIVHFDNEDNFDPDTNGAGGEEPDQEANLGGDRLLDDSALPRDQTSE